MVPVGDLLGQPFLDGSLGLQKELQFPRLDFLKVIGYHVGYGISQSVGFQIPSNPTALLSGHYLIRSWLIVAQGSVVQVGSMILLQCLKLRIHFNVEHPLRDSPLFPGTRATSILDAMFQVNEDTRSVTVIVVIHQHGALTQQITVPFQGQVYGGIQKGMAWTDEHCRQLACGSHA